MLQIDCNLKLQPYSISFLLEMNSDKFTIGLHLILISIMLAKFQEYQRLITMSSIKCLIISDWHEIWRVLRTKNAIQWLDFKNM